MGQSQFKYVFLTTIAFFQLPLVLQFYIQSTNAKNGVIPKSNFCSFSTRYFRQTYSEITSTFMSLLGYVPPWPLGFSLTSEPFAACLACHLCTLASFQSPPWPFYHLLVFNPQRISPAECPNLPPTCIID